MFSSFNERHCAGSHRFSKKSSILADIQVGEESQENQLKTSSTTADGLGINRMQRSSERSRTLQIRALFISPFILHFAADVPAQRI